MLKTIRAAAAGASTLLLLAACGGQPDNASTPAELPHAQVSGTPVGSAPPAFDPATVQVGGGAAVADGDATSLTRQVALLRLEVGEIRQQLARMPGAVTSAEPPPRSRTDPAARLEAERADQQRIASTETAFRGEKEDARWSQGAMASVRAAMADANESLRNQVRSVECRSQSCRVVIGGDPGGPAGQDLSLVVSGLAQTLPNVTAGQIDQGDGRPATVLYLSR